MIKRKAPFLVSLCLLFLSSSCTEPNSQPLDSPMHGDFWKNQAINDIITPWTKNAFNSQKSTFPAYLDKRWQTFRGNSRYPGMVSRHIFSYSTAYLLTGDDKYLDTASQIVDDLIQNGWDNQNKLWYNEINEEGEVVDPDKDMFMQLYAVTGLSMYYVATQNKEILEYIDNSIDLLNKHAWDNQNGGYVNSLNNDLSVKEQTKKATPQLAPLSGYLAYLYPTTKIEQYLSDTKRGMRIVSSKMLDPEEPWLLESFNEQWQINKENSSNINVGHNLEVVWMNLRLYLLTGDENYKKNALNLYPQLYDVAFSEETGAWYHRFKRQDTNEKPDTTPWWIQAYGNMLELYMYRVTGEEKHLDRFRQGSEFWNNYFIDKEFGGAYLKTGIDGMLADGNKAVRSKTSYHSMEHGLLNYLYLNLWVQDQSATLYFRINSSDKGDIFHPNITEDPEVTIKSVKINGEKWDQFNTSRSFISLPKLDKGNIQVEFTRE